PPRPPLFPYTTLFRSHVELEVGRNGRLDDLQLAREQDGRDPGEEAVQREDEYDGRLGLDAGGARSVRIAADCVDRPPQRGVAHPDRKSTRLNSSHGSI